MFFWRTTGRMLLGLHVYHIKRSQQFLVDLLSVAPGVNANTVECRREYMVKRDSNPARASGTLNNSCRQPCFVRSQFSVGWPGSTEGSPRKIES